MVHLGDVVARLGDAVAHFGDVVAHLGSSWRLGGSYRTGVADLVAHNREVVANLGVAIGILLAHFADAVAQFRELSPPPPPPNPYCLPVQELKTYSEEFIIFL